MLPWRTVVGLGVLGCVVQVAVGRVEGGQQGRLQVLHKAVVEQGLIVALADLVVLVHQLRSTLHLLSVLGMWGESALLGSCAIIILRPILEGLLHAACASKPAFRLTAHDRAGSLLLNQCNGIAHAATAIRP